MENIVNEKIRRQGLRGTILRFGNFYGHDSGHTQGMIEAISKGKMPVVGKGDSFYNVIHNDDAASAVVYAVNHPQQVIGKTINVSDFHPVTFKEVLEYLAAQTGAKNPRRVPVWLAKLFVGKAAVSFLTDSYQNKVNRLNGWEPKYRSYQEGFREVLER